MSPQNVVVLLSCTAIVLSFVNAVVAWIWRREARAYMRRGEEQWDQAQLVWRVLRGGAAPEPKEETRE